MFADANYGFTSVNLYAAEETTETETEETDKEVSDMVAGEDEKAPAKEVGKKNMVPVYGNDIIDGTYDIEVDSSSSMFRIVKAQLTVKEGEMSAVLTLGGKGYLRLFMGTGEEAVAAPESEYAEYVEDADGAYTYEVKVEALDKPLECTGFSKRKEKWYDHQIVFEAASLEADALLITLPNYDEEEKTTQVSENNTQEAESKTTENMAQMSENAEQERANLADGVYNIDVTLSGGSAKSLDGKEVSDGMDWNLVFLILLAVVTGATVAIYGTSRKK